MEIFVCNAVETLFILYLTHSLRGSSLDVNACEPRGDGFSFCGYQLLPSFFPSVVVVVPHRFSKRKAQNLQYLLLPVIPAHL